MKNHRRNKAVKVFITCILTGMFLLTGVFGSMAETVLKSVTVSYSFPDREGGRVQLPEFEAPRGCTLDIEWLSPKSSYAPGKTVKAQITLRAEDGYEFDKSAKITVHHANITSKSVSSSEIVLQVKVGPLYYKLAAPEHVSWSKENSSVLKWSKVEYATGYRVSIYQDEKVVKTEIIKSRSYDVGKYFNGDSQVTASVTAVADSSGNRKYIRDSKVVFVDGNDIEWEDRETTYGVWQGNRYRVSGDGEKAEYAIGWVEIFGEWYFFNQSGILQTGWIEDGGKRYYSNKEGVMQIGWVKPETKGPWYYFRSSGEMAVGWVSGQPGSWYYLNPDGTMRIGWLDENEKRYFLGTDGKMLTGWQLINCQWHYFHPDGHMAVNEQIEGYNIDGAGVCTDRKRV